MGGQYFVKKYPLNCIKQAATLKCIELLLFPLCPPQVMLSTSLVIAR